MTLPLLHLRGRPYEQGRQQGEALRERIDHNIALYFARFAGEVRLDCRAVLARAARYLAAIEADSPNYYAGLRGVADGCGRDLIELAALNVRYEILYYQDREGRAMYVSDGPPCESNYQRMELA